MSLATSIKDLADVLNEISAAKGFTGDIPKTLLLQQTLIHSAKALYFSISYIVSFQWYRDISFLPLLAPELNPTSFFASNLLDNPTSHIFSFSQLPKQSTDQLFAGLINSFFVSLPFSLPHLVSCRRMLLQGPAAAAASLSGIILANMLLMIGVMFGLRFLIVPFLALEPFNYLIGVVLIAVMVKSFAQQKGFKLVPFWDKMSLIKIGLFTFVLTCCEQTSIFHTLNNLTLNAQNTHLELYPSDTTYSSFLVHTTYLLAFFVGHCVFSMLIYYIIFLTIRYLSTLRWFTTRMITQRASKAMLVLIVAFTMSSLPYYGLDYLLASKAGFLPEDPVYSNTLLSPTQVKTKYPHFFKEIPPAQRDENTPLNLDLNYFDRGLYLNAPKQEKAVQPSLPIPALTFEELNYQGEYAWIMRNQLSKDLSKMRPSVFTPMFKKPRRRYIQLRKLYDKKMEQAARLANTKMPKGSMPTYIEGVLPGERASIFMKMTDFLGRAFLLPTEVELEMSDFEMPSSQLFLSDSNALDYETGPKSSSSNMNKSDDIGGKGQSKRSNMFGVQQGERQEALSDNAGGKQVSKQFANFAKKKKNDPLKEELLVESKIQRGYSKGFAPSFSLPYERMRLRLLPVKNVIKKRYFLNNVYKSLLEIDIDSFLARQPAAYKLAQNQEGQLFEKRQILHNYYNWLRYYQPFEKMLKLRYHIPDTRSFVDKVYHQQFKGTLKIARRLFKVSFDSKQNPEKHRVLSYDQLLYNNLSDHENPYLHEESKNKFVPFKNSSAENQDKTGTEILAKGGLVGAESVSQDRNGSSLPSVYKGKNITEQSDYYLLKAQPFIEESATSPTYAGWDPESRCFLVTNRFVVKHVTSARDPQ